MTRDVDWLIAGTGELIAAAVAAGAALDELRDAGHALAAAAC